MAKISNFKKPSFFVFVAGLLMIGSGIDAKSKRVIQESAAPAEFVKLESAELVGNIDMDGMCGVRVKTDRGIRDINLREFQLVLEKEPSLAKELGLTPEFLKDLYKKNDDFMFGKILIQLKTGSPKCGGVLTRVGNVLNDLIAAAKKSGKPLTKYSVQQNLEGAMLEVAYPGAPAAAEAPAARN